MDGGFSLRILKSPAFIHCWLERLVPPPYRPCHLAHSRNQSPREQASAQLPKRVALPTSARYSQQPIEVVNTERRIPA